MCNENQCRQKKSQKMGISNSMAIEFRWELYINGILCEKKIQLETNKNSPNWHHNWFFVFHVLCITWPMRQMELIQIQLTILYSLCFTFIGFAWARYCCCCCYCYCGRHAYNDVPKNNPDKFMNSRGGREFYSFYLNLIFILVPGMIWM